MFTERDLGVVNCAGFESKITLGERDLPVEELKCLSIVVAF